MRQRMWLLLCIVSLTIPDTFPPAAGAAELTDFSPEGVETFLEANRDVDTPAEFLASLPAEFKQHWVMMTRSESTQTGTATSPRFLLPSRDASKVFGFALRPDPNFPLADPEIIEFLHFEGATNRFRFHEIDIGSRTVVQDKPVCQACHGGDPTTGQGGRPNWDAYDSWGGMLPFNRDRIYEGSQEAMAVKRLLEDLKDDPIVGQLDLPRGITRDPATGEVTVAFDRNDRGTGNVDVFFRSEDGRVSYPGPEGPITVPQGGRYLRLHHSGKGDATDEGRGVALFDQFTALNARRVARQLLDHPAAPVDIRPIALAIARGCVDAGNFGDHAPPGALDVLVAHHRTASGGTVQSFEDLLRDTGERRQSLPKKKADLQAENLGGAAPFGVIRENRADPTAETITRDVARRSREGFALDTLTGFMIDREVYGDQNTRIALFRFFLEPLNVRVDKWSMSVLGNRGDRSTTYTFGDLFGNYIARITAELTTVLESAGQGVECADLRAASIAAFQGLVPAPPPPPPLLAVQEGVVLSIDDIATDAVNNTLSFRIENIGREGTGFRGTVVFDDRTEDRNELGRETFEGFINGATETDPEPPRVEFSVGIPEGCTGTDVPIEQRGCDLFITVSGGGSTAIASSQ